jgi:hypothetical protein
MVKNPKRTVPLATMLGTAMAGIVYIRAQVIAGILRLRWLPPVRRSLSAPQHILGGWAAPVCFHRICLPDFSGLLDDAGWSGRGPCR